MPSIHINQSDALYDQAIQITIDGFVANEIVELVASRFDHEQVEVLRSCAHFEADQFGQVDLSIQAPISGSYDEVSPMGIFWSMERVQDVTGSPSDISEPLHFTITARALDRSRSVSEKVLRRFTGLGVSNRWVRENGLVGRLFMPPGKGPHPAMIGLTGSSGGIDEFDAALLASHGFASFALGYFAMEELPSLLDSIPLEYFGKAMNWLCNQDGVSGDFVGTIGASRGGELGLLLGATFPQIKAVVGYAPSGVIHCGLARSEETGENGPAWTFQGDALPWLTQNNSCTDHGCSDWEISPIVTTPLFETSLRDKCAVAESSIPVERINGPVLLVSGTDDHMWPSTQMAKLAMERLKQHNHPHPFEHLIYEGAGHLIGPPFFPTTRRHSRHEILDVDFSYGGTPAADARACIDSWPKVLQFLKSASCIRKRAI